MVPANFKLSPSAMCLYEGPQTSTPVSLPDAKLEDSESDSAEDELDVESLDDNTIAHLLPLVRQIRDEYCKIDERKSALLKKIGVAYEQLSDDSKTAVDSIMKQQKVLIAGSTSASAIKHAGKQRESFFKERRSETMKEDILKLSQMLAEQTQHLEMTKFLVGDITEITKDEESALQKMQMKTKSPAAIQKKLKRAEALETKLERLQMNEVTPQACVAELEKRSELEEETKIWRQQLKEFCDLPPDIAAAEKVLRDRKQQLVNLKAQLKALYKP